MYTITFYSFKGGVGRTMALVNVAAEWVRRGRKVLVVDFDLEAPGLETYQHLCSDKPHQGIVEFVTDFRRNFEVPDVLDYLYETKPIGKKGGRMWVMPAGRRDRAYRIALANLDWPRLYKDESGFLLFEDAKLGWESPWGLGFPGRHLHAPVTRLGRADVHTQRTKPGRPGKRLPRYSPRGDRGPKEED